MNKHILVTAVAVCLATAGIAQAAPASGAQGQGPTSVSAHLSATQRGAFVAQIVGAWGAYVQQVYGASTAAWAQRMQATFSAATDSNLQRAARMKTFQGMMDALVGQHLTDAQVLDSLTAQAQALGSGAKPALLGSTTADLTFTPLANCRIVDTHVVGGPIAGGFTRSFKAHTTTDFTAQGGATSRCGIPANPSVLMLNVTTLAPTQAGSLSVYPYGTTKPKDANLNYKVGQNVNNEMAAKMTIGSATDDFTVYVSGTTDVLIDVVGYFMAPQATPLDTTLSDTTATIIPAGDSSSSAIVGYTSCPIGYVQTGGFCYAGSASGVYLTGVGQGYCAFRNLSGTDQSVYAYQLCARIPGR
jgi:hypothetical protein